MFIGRSRQGFCFGNKTAKYKQKQTVHTHSYSWMSTNTVLALSKGLHNLKKKMKMLSFRNQWISGMRIEDAQLYTFSVSYHKLRGYKSCYQESHKKLCKQAATKMRPQGENSNNEEAVCPWVT